MAPRIIRDPLPPDELRAAADHPGGMVKVVVDVHRKVLAFGMDLHADGEQLLLDDGARQEDLWGANVYPGNLPAERIEYTSLINIRPRQGNRTLTIEDPDRRAAVQAVVDALLPPGP